jgi:hypothetical protein
MPDPAGKRAWEAVLRDATVDLDVRIYMLLAISYGDFDDIFSDRLGDAGTDIKDVDYGSEEEGTGSSI